MGILEERYTDLLKLPTGNVADALGPSNIMHSSIKPIDPCSKVLGRAFPAECFPGDNLTLHQAIAEAGKGDVLVFDCMGYTEAGHFGDMMATACLAKGIAGVILDGSCRDSQDIKAMGFPVFASAYSPRGTVKESLGSLNVPVVCGGVWVRPGDIIFGDCDGVVVVPQERETEVFEKAIAKYEKEIQLREQLLRGISTMEVYGFQSIIDKKRNK